MTTRRGRTSHVRPRPPSNGRPAPTRIKARPPVTGRIATHRRIERTGRLPIVLRVLFAAGIAALGIAVFAVATGGLVRVAGAVGASLSGFVDDLAATPTPAPTQPLAVDAPFIDPPNEPYTNASSVDLVITLPSDAVGVEGTTVLIYLALPEQDPAPIDEVPVGATPRLVVPVALTDGQNDFTATIVGPGGDESEPSAVVTYVLDTKKPKVTISSPKNGATINRTTITIEGKTQARSRIVARNDANAASVTGAAESDGSFRLTLPIEPGSNPITVGATDPAGNAGEAAVTIRRGSGKLTASLTASTYRLSRAKLPDPLTLTVAVNDPDGHPLGGAEVTFTLSIPGFPAAVYTTRTGSNGRASFRTTVNKGADRGTGQAAVLVVTDEFGQTTDRTVITIAK